MNSIQMKNGMGFEKEFLIFFADELLLYSRAAKMESKQFLDNDNVVMVHSYLSCQKKVQGIFVESLSFIQRRTFHYLQYHNERSY